MLREICDTTWKTCFENNVIGIENDHAKITWLLPSNNMEDSCYVPNIVLPTFIAQSLQKLLTIEADNARHNQSSALASRIMQPEEDMIFLDLHMKAKK